MVIWVQCQKGRVETDIALLCVPTCHRCTSTGRTCDGYDFSSRNSSPNSDAVLSLLPGSIEEQRSIHFFSTYSAPQFGGFFDTTFWTEAVLQAVRANPAIRHAVSALGVLHAKFLASDRPVVSSSISDEDLKFALQQCNQSIECLMKQSVDDPETTLTACVLFISFASMQGHQLQALNHLRGGLRLLDEIDSSADKTKGHAAHPVQLATLRIMFASFNAQARCMLNTTMLADWTHEATMKPEALPTSISDVETAQNLADELYYSTLTFIQKLDASPPSMEDMPTIIAKHDDLMRRLALIKYLLADFLARQVAARLIEKQQTSVWRTSIYLHVAEIYLYLVKPPSNLEPSILDRAGLTEQAWGKLELHYSAIIELARKILTSHVRSDLSNRPSFSTSLGVIMPLFMVASRCRHPHLRREAIQLLIANPRREGIWDSILAGKIAARGMEIEEEGHRLQAQLNISAESTWIIPESHRISHFEIMYNDDRKAEVVFWTTAQRLILVTVLDPYWSGKQEKGRRLSNSKPCQHELSLII
jgi:hypothetical protein